MCSGHWGGVNSVIEFIASYDKMYNLPSPSSFRNSWIRQYINTDCVMIWLVLIRAAMKGTTAVWDRIKKLVRLKSGSVITFFINIGPQAFYCRKQWACFHYVCLNHGWGTSFWGQKLEIQFTLHAVSLNQSKSALYANLIITTCNVNDQELLNSGLG